MTSSEFSPDWIKQFSSDPYGILGVAVTADERRISKRYRQVAKQLHPDQQLNADEAVRDFSSQMLKHLVNPAYQRLKQDKGRSETLAALRFKVRHLNRQKKLVARGALAKQLMEADEAALNIIYEKALADLADPQYNSADTFLEKTLAISELNLIYLQRQIGNLPPPEKPWGLVPKPDVPSSDPYAPAVAEVPRVDYAQRHIQRGKAYIANKNYPKAIKEFRDAVRIQPQDSMHHTMLAQAYLLQKMVGMSKVHIKQALKLEPNNLVALKYARKLDIEVIQGNVSRASKVNRAMSDRKRSPLHRWLPWLFPTQSVRPKLNSHRHSKGFFSFLGRFFGASQKQAHSFKPTNIYHRQKRRSFLYRFTQIFARR